MLVHLHRAIYDKMLDANFELSALLFSTVDLTLKIHSLCIMYNVSLPSAFDVVFLAFFMDLLKDVIYISL